MVGLPQLFRAVRQVDVNPVGPGGLLDAFTNATDQFIRGQLYAETIMMQETLQFTGIDKALETQIIDFQNRMKGQATYFYDQIITGNYGYIVAVAGGYHMCALVTVTIDVTAGDIEIAASNDKARRSAASSYSMLADQAYDQSVVTATLATKVTSLDRSLAQYVVAYREALKVVEADLSSAAKTTLEEIETLRQAINQNLSDIVAGGEEVGGAVTNLIVGVLTEITKDKPSAPEKGSQAAKVSEGDSFGVLAIKAVATGASKLSQAEKDLNANNDKLAAAYQRLAQDQTMVAVAKAIEVQNDLFATMVPLAAGASQDINIAFQTVEANLTGFSASITSVTEDNAAASLAKQAHRAEPQWAALNSELQEMKKMIIA